MRDKKRIVEKCKTQKKEEASRLCGAFQSFFSTPSMIKELQPAVFVTILTAITSISQVYPAFAF